MSERTTLARHQEPTKSETTRRLKERLNLKRGHLRYLESCVADPAPILAEIKRHENHIATHQAAIERLQHRLATPTEHVEDCKDEIVQLEAAIAALNPPKPQTAIKVLEQKNAKLQRKLDRLAKELGLNLEEL